MKFLNIEAIQSLRYIGYLRVFDAFKTLGEIRRGRWSSDNFPFFVLNEQEVFDFVLLGLGFFKH